MADQEEKTEAPTGKHVTEATERGQFARAPEIQVLFTIGAVLAVLGFTARSSCERLVAYSSGIFSTFPKRSLVQDSMPKIWGDMLATVGPIVAPMLGACAGAALLAGGLQSGFNLTPKVLGLNWDRLNFVEGFGRVFNAQVFPRVGIDMLKVLAIGATLYAGAKHLLMDPLFSAPVESAYLAQFLNQTAITFFGRLLFALAVVGAVSYGYERHKTGKELKMTRQEVKDEHKNSQGDTGVKIAQRRLARRLLQTQMLDAVPTADVVVTNPTHFAIALKYERGRDAAPVILAKGEQRFARRIKEIAAENGVPMVENKPVARLLFAMGKVGEAIPPELYQAVAEILAVVYRTHRYYFYRLRSRRLENGS